jgi:DnaK suppressor protein
MKRTEYLEQIYRLLARRRDEIFKAHLRAEDDRRSLMEPEVEFEETAQNGSIADTIAQLDERDRQEVEAIDRALEKMKLGKYGRCEVCGKPIAVKRLVALPWTSFCALHAKQQTEPLVLAAQTNSPLPSEYEGLSGKALGGIIADELREDGDVDLDELKIAVRAGQLHLEGFLPTEAQRRRLLEIVQDHLEFTSVVDEVIVNRAPWEREDRTPGTKEIEDFLEEVEAEETEVGQGPIAPRKSGSPLNPPETLVPEER